jgi:hypothetical protein
MTFFAPAAMCFCAVSLVRNRPVASIDDVGADLAPLQLGRILHGGEADAAGR